jgi:hypothetical protein
MKLNKTAKIIVGLATGSYLLLPILFIVVWITALVSAAAGTNQAEPPPIFFAILFSMFPLICLVNLLHFGVQIFYIIHIIKNKTGNETYRVLSGIGMFILPWLAAPIYFFIYVWPDDAPEWALDPSEQPEPALPPAPVTYPAEEGLDPAFEGELEEEVPEAETEAEGKTLLGVQAPEEIGLLEETEPGIEDDLQEANQETPPQPDAPLNEEDVQGDGTMISSQSEISEEEPSTSPDPNDPAQTIIHGDTEATDNATIIGDLPIDEPDKDD